jgi:MFS family permease
MMYFSRFALNRTIAIIIAFDFFVVGAFALLSPIYAVFVVEKIPGGTPAIVGYALAIYWVVKSILQIPIARYLDRNHGEKDDLIALGLGVALGGLVMVGYSFAREVWHIYFLQFFFGVADSILIPPFYAIFTRHIDKGSEGFEWALRSSISFGGGSALGGAIGGVMAVRFGFASVFLTIAAISFLSLVILWFLRKEILPRVPREVVRIPLEPHKR